MYLKAISRFLPFFSDNRMRQTPKCVVAIAWFLAAPMGLCGSLTNELGGLADEFDPGANGSVRVLAIQADGKILVGGNFTSLGGLVRNYIGRLNVDGTIDAGFNPGANGMVLSLAVQTNGKILVGGQFTVLGGQPRYFIGRLNEDGTLDSGFDPVIAGGNYPSYASSLAIQADEKILVGGNFTGLAGRPRNWLGRLNSDGTLDVGFNPGAGDGSANYPYVFTLALQTDGKILVGGNFTTLGGLPRERIGRLNASGTIDSGFNPGANDYVRSFAVQADGRILVGGNFTSLGGQPRSRIGRLNADGTLDFDFDPGANGYIYSLAVQADGKILVGGEFTILGGQARYCVGRLNADGTLDSEFNPVTDAWVSSLCLQADGRILIGGKFTTMGGLPRNCIGRLNNTEAATQSLGFGGATITWLRSGSAPEVWRTTFDYSSDRIHWTNLGSGSRRLGQTGWELANISLPPSGTLRARGYAAGGFQNSSGWFIEALYSLEPTLEVRRTGNTAFTLLLSGLSRPSCVIETTTNLTPSPYWFPIWSGALSNTPQIISETNGGEPGRYFRAVTP